MNASNRIHLNNRFLISGDNISIKVIWNNLTGRNQFPHMTRREYLSMVETEWLNQPPHSTLKAGDTLTLHIHNHQEHYILTSEDLQPDQYPKQLPAAYYISLNGTPVFSDYDNEVVIAAAQTLTGARLMAKTSFISSNFYRSPADYIRHWFAPVILGMPHQRLRGTDTIALHDSNADMIISIKLKDFGVGA